LNSKIKILFISHSPHFNGAEICLLALVKNINRDLFEPVVAFPYTGPMVDEMIAMGIKTYISPYERWIRFAFDKPIKSPEISKRVSYLVSIIQEESIDIVHSNTSVVAEGALAAKISGKHHVWHIHEYLTGHPELIPNIPLPLVHLVIEELSDAVVCVSNYVKKQFKYISNNNKFITIYNSTHDNFVNQNNIDIRNFLGLDRNSFISVTVGLLSQTKGYILWLDAVDICLRENSKLKFLWVGGAHKKDLKAFNAKVKKMGIQNSVFYLGFREDVPAILHGCDLLVCTSLTETFSLSILEGMSSGLPIVTTDCGGPAEIVVNNETGYVVDSGNSSKIADKIIELSNDEVKRKKFGNKGKDRYETLFKLDKYVINFEKLYMDILNRKINEKSSAKAQSYINSFLSVYGKVSQDLWKVDSWNESNLE
jgi:glycosyltransferase involved in cell wall biosynthesis